MKKEYRNSARTRKMIREAFADLISEKKTISEIGVAELAEKADIAKSTFYNHYDDIYSVADEILGEIEENLNLLIDAMESDPDADYRAYLKNIFDFLKTNETVYRKLLCSNDATMFISRIKYVIIRRVTSSGVLPMVEASDASKQLKTRFLINACVDTMVEYLRGEIKMSFYAVVEELFDCIDKIIQ